MVPHGGTDTKIWRETVELGARLKDLGEIKGSRVPRADVVMIFDYHALWASELRSTPSNDAFKYVDRPRALHRALTDRGIAVDVVRPGQDLSGYRAVLVPNLYLVSDETADAIRKVVDSGGHALITYFSGITDENDHIRLGGYPGAFRELLGINVEEFFPLLAGQEIELDNGWTADIWTELVNPRGAQVVASYQTGDLAGGAAVTRNTVGSGTAWYVSARLDVGATAELIDQFATVAGLVPVVATTPGVEVMRRVGATASYLFVLKSHGRRRRGLGVRSGSDDGQTPPESDPDPRRRRRRLAGVRGLIAARIVIGPRLGHQISSDDRQRMVKSIQISSRLHINSTGHVPMFWS